MGPRDARGQEDCLECSWSSHACLLPMGVFWMLQEADLEEKTHDLYLIPKGYAGQVRIVHEIENAPVPRKVRCISDEC